MPGDPYAAKGWPRTASGEVRTELEQFTARLTDLGATPDEVQAVADTWDDLDPDDDTDPEAFTKARRTELLHLPDADLAAMLQATRDEYDVGTTTEADAEHQRAVAAFNAAYREAADRIGGNVQSVLAWVGDNPARARAVLIYEQSPEGAARKTLIEPLQDLAATAPVGPAGVLVAPPRPDAPADHPHAASGPHSGADGKVG